MGEKKILGPLQNIHMILPPPNQFYFHVCVTTNSVCVCVCNFFSGWMDGRTLLALLRGEREKNGGENAVIRRLCQWPSLRIIQLLGGNGIRRRRRRGGKISPRGGKMLHWLLFLAFFLMNFSTKKFCHFRNALKFPLCDFCYFRIKSIAKWKFTVYVCSCAGRRTKKRTKWSELKPLITRRSRSGISGVPFPALLISFFLSVPRKPGMTHPSRATSEKCNNGVDGGGNHAARKSS